MQKRTLILFLSFWAFGILLKAQHQDLQLHFLDRAIQKQNTNPAWYPNSTVNIFLIPSFSFDVGHSGFDYKDLIKVRAIDDSLYLDIPNILDKVKDQNRLHFHSRIDLMGIQFRVKKKFYMSLGLSEHLRTGFTYPGDLVKFAWEGNAGSIGETIELSPSFYAKWYREYYVGLAYTIKKKYTIGARFKYLTGQADVSTTRANATLTTGAELYELGIGLDAQIRTAGIAPIITDSTFELDPVAFAINTGNTGFGFDLGFVAQPTERLTLTAAVNDIGFIDWKKDTRDFSIQGDYTFNGFESLSFDSLNILDSLLDSFDTTSTTESYREWLAPRIYVSGIYDISSTVKLGALFQADIRDKKLDPAFMLSVTKRLKPLDIGLTYSIRDGRYNNIGVMGSLNLWVFQVFAATESLPNLLRPRNSRYFDVRFGFNLNIGHGRREANKEKREQRKADRKEKKGKKGKE